MNWLLVVRFHILNLNKEKVNSLKGFTFSFFSNEIDLNYLAYYILIDGPGL